MTDVHTEHRDLLAAGDDVDCDECAGFADRLASLRGAARLLDDAAAPADLADRVAASVLAAPSPVARRLVVRSLAIAAAALLVVGIVAVLPRGEDDPGRKLLLAAATSTEDAGSARIRVHGSADIEVPRMGESSPDFDGVPTEMRGYLERRWAEIEAKFEADVAEFERRAEAAINEGMRQAEEAFDRAMREFGRGGSQGPPPTRPARPAGPEPGPGPGPGPGPAAPRPQLPDRVTVGVAVAGEGIVGFDGRLALTGTVQPVPGSVGAPTASAGFEVRASADAPVVRRPDGGWASLSAGVAAQTSTPWAALLASPDGVVRLLRSAEGDVEIVGESGGLRHVRFAVGEDSAEAWIDGDDRVQRVTVTSERSPEGARWRSVVTAELREFGVAVPEVEVPQAGGEAGASSSLVYPLGPAVTAALEEGR